MLYNYNPHHQVEQHLREQKLKLRHLAEAKLSTTLSEPVLNWKNSLFIGIILSIIMFMIL